MINPSPKYQNIPPFVFSSFGIRGSDVKTKWDYFDIQFGEQYGCHTQKNENMSDNSWCQMTSLLVK